MTEDDTRPVRPAGPSAMSERMQVLLSRAAEEQLVEQRQVSAVLAELRSLVAGLAEQLRATASSARLEGLSGDVHALSTALRQTTTGLGERLEELGRRVDEQSASSAEVVRAAGTGTEAVAVRVTALAGDVAAQAEALDRVVRALASVPTTQRLDEAVTTGVTRLEGALAAVRADLEALRSEVAVVREDVALPQVMLALGGLREDVEDLAGSLAGVDVPTADAVATAVTAQVTDRLVGELAPRVADLVLSRVAETLVDQVSGSVATSVQNGLTERVRAANADTERRLSAHVDEAVLALAEALLRRRRGGRAAVTVGLEPVVVDSGTDTAAHDPTGDSAPLVQDAPAAAPVVQTSADASAQPTDLTGDAADVDVAGELEAADAQRRTWGKPTS